MLSTATYQPTTELKVPKQLPGVLISVIEWMKTTKQACYSATQFPFSVWVSHLHCQYTFNWVEITHIITFVCFLARLGILCFASLVTPMNVNLVGQSEHAQGIILMRVWWLFVSQRDTTQCCDVTKLDCTYISITHEAFCQPTGEFNHCST